MFFEDGYQNKASIAGPLAGPEERRVV